MDKTMIFNVNDLDNYMITETLIKVKEALEEKGYNPFKQITGYLLSGDLSYISHNKNARNIIEKIDREKIVEALLKNYLQEDL